jgi:hypothetical protein
MALMDLSFGGNGRFEELGATMSCILADKRRICCLISYNEAGTVRCVWIHMMDAERRTSI